MAHSSDDLRRHILWGATEREGFIVLVKAALLREAEVCNSDVTLVIQNDILWLKIP